MNSDNILEPLATKNSNEIQQVKDIFGIEIVCSEILPTELIEIGYKKMEISEACYFEPLLQMAAQIVVDKVKNTAVKKAFEEITKNSYKCILDPSKHLATIKGRTDIYIGSALDNATNQLSGQARWLKNDVILSVPNMPQVALNAFNALSIVTGQYFMSQINSSLSEIKDSMVDILQYFDDLKQSELQTALQDLNEIIEHLGYIKKDSERVRNTVAQVDEIRNVSKNKINLRKNQIERIICKKAVADKEIAIANNIESIQKYIVQYRYAVYIYNLAQILKIYLNNITDTQELFLYRDGLNDIVNQYKKTFSKAMDWVKTYLDENKTLNEVGKTQILLSLSSGIVVGILGSNFNLSSKTALFMKNLFDDNRKKKKEKYVLSHKKYQDQMNDMILVDSSISAMNKYIAMTEQKVEIVSLDGDYYIKYVDEN